jgi:hypothetical protein
MSEERGVVRRKACESERPEGQVTRRADYPRTGLACHLGFPCFSNQGPISDADFCPSRTSGFTDQESAQLIIYSFVHLIVRNWELFINQHASSFNCSPSLHHTLSPLPMRTLWSHSIGPPTRPSVPITHPISMLKLNAVQYR